ncbi:MAG: histidinol-phosphate transaminase [Clostridia bacterium]|nr:histidinol-phosphate transaminase [Clostridia bacterium]
MSRFLNSKYKNLEAYTPGEQPKDMEYIKLNTNESPYPPSKEVLEAVNKSEVELLKLYPDPEAKKLKVKLAALHGVTEKNIYLANGSDDILNFAFMAFCGDGKQALFPDITYGFYKVFAELHGVKYTALPLEDDFSIDYKKYFNAKGMVVIANPNAPTGLNLPLDAIEEVIKNNPDNVVLIDEAYVDFGGESAYKLTKKYDNLLVVQTFSKSRSMAGARLGFAIASEGIIEDLEKIKYSTNPYNINRLTMVAGEAAVDSNEYYMENCKKICNTREYTTKELERLGFEVIDSKTNFIFAKHHDFDGQKVYNELKAKGILVRHFINERIFQYNRITIGSEEQMKIFIEKITEIVRG